MNGRGLKYVDSFWNSDINSSDGFDALKSRMRDGRKLCKDIEDYLRQRAKIEAQFAKELQKLARSTTSDIKDEGQLENAWKILKKQTENISAAHDSAGTDFGKLASEISSFNDEQKQKTKAVEDKITKLHNAAKSSNQKATNAHRTYQQKCRDWESARDALCNAENSVASITPKDMEKIRNKHNKCKEEMEKADSNYKTSIDELKYSQNSWEKETEDGCKVLQDLDEKRIYHLRDSLWKCTNVDSEACVLHDEYSEKVRLSLEQCDVEQEIDEFVKSRSTGSVRPATVPYEDYFGSSPAFNGKTSTIDKRSFRNASKGGFSALMSSPAPSSGYSIYSEIK